MKLYLIRHGKTAGNLKKAYVGRTDEPLCSTGIEELHELWGDKPPQVDRLYVSPMLRCRQTAELIFPGAVMIPVEDLRECDFGVFEGKNHIELDGDPRYQTWIDSGGRGDFPEGESLTAFKRRCSRAFARVVETCIKDGVSRVAFVVHGGTIMSVMEAFACPPKDYYDWMTANGRAVEVTLDEGEWRTGRTLLYYSET